MRARWVISQPGDMASQREKMVQDCGPWRVAGNRAYTGGSLTLLERTGPYPFRRNGRPAA